MFRRQPKRPVSLFEDAAASERLKSVTGRGRVEESLYPIAEEQLETPAIRRRFWTPDEIIETAP